MANYGNTGQRYKMTTRQSYTLEPDGGITFHMTCGHDIRHGAPQFTPWSAEEADKWIGTRTRCDRCAK